MIKNNSLVKKSNGGNTIIVVLVILIIVAIISLGISFQVAFTSNYRINKSNQMVRFVIMENEMYDLLNDCEANKNDLSNITNIIDNYITDFNGSDSNFEMKYSYNSVTYKYTIQIRYKQAETGLLCEVEFDVDPNTKYAIIKWGEDLWN